MSKILSETVIENIKLSDDLYKMTIESEYTASKAMPGNFINVECCGGINTVLRRPISICDVDVKKGRFLIAYRIVGTGTQAMRSIGKGDKINFVGPLGNSFPETDTGDVLIIGGGIGVFPLLYLAKNNKVKKDIILGFRDRSEIVMKKEFGRNCDKLEIMTDNGSYGKQGFVTDNLESILDSRKYSAVYACGPEPMLIKVKDMAEKRQIMTYVSLEQRMGCGIGACLVCSVKLKDGEDYKYGRVCKDGPVFLSSEVIFD